MLPALQAKWGHDLYLPNSIPKAVYNQPADIPVITVSNLLVVSESMPEPLAHDITRVLFEHQPELVTIHPQARALQLASALRGSPVPFHEGAIRFYRDRGAWTE